MKGHWYLRCSQEEAELFNWNEERDSLETIVKTTNPLGRTRTKEMRNDKPGVGRGGFAGNVAPHSLDGEKDPHVGAAHDFARAIAQFLFEEQKKLGFKRVFVAAEPKFLGQLREKFERLEDQIEFVWIGKDLTKTPVHELKTHFEKSAERTAAGTGRG